MNLSRIPNEIVTAVAREALRRGLMEVELADVDSSRLAKELLTRRKRPGGVKLAGEKLEQILADLRTLTWEKCAQKHGVSVRTISRAAKMRPREEGDSPQTGSGARQ